MADAHNWPNFVTGQQVWLDYIPADIAPLVSFDAHWGSLNKAQAGWFLKKKKKKKRIKSIVWSLGRLAGFLKKKKNWRDSLKPRQAGRFLKKKKRITLLFEAQVEKLAGFYPKKKRIPEVWLKCYRWDLELFKEMLPLERNDKIRIKI